MPTATQQRSALCGGAIHQKDAQAKKNYEMAIIIVGTNTRTHASLSPSRSLTLFDAIESNSTTALNRSSAAGDAAWGCTRVVVVVGGWVCVVVVATVAVALVGTSCRVRSARSCDVAVYIYVSVFVSVSVCS